MAEAKELQSNLVNYKAQLQQVNDILRMQNRVSHELWLLQFSFTAFNYASERVLVVYYAFEILCI